VKLDIKVPAEAELFISFIRGNRVVSNWYIAALNLEFRDKNSFVPTRLELVEETASKRQILLWKELIRLFRAKRLEVTLWHQKTKASTLLTPSELLKYLLALSDFKAKKLVGTVVVSSETKSVA